MITVLQWFLAPGSWSRTIFFTLATVYGVTLLFLQYKLGSRDHKHRSPLTSSRDIKNHSSIIRSTESLVELRRRQDITRLSVIERRRQQHISRVAERYNYSIGLIWPSDDVDDYNDRIASQIDFMNVYGQQKRDRKLKVILRVGYFQKWVAGQERFIRDKCPITDCWWTDNQSQARDADALLISDFSHGIRHLYLPKPAGQIWIAHHRESPLHNHIDPNSLRGLVNWTGSYRHDSTVVFPISKMVPSAPATGAVTFGKEVTNYAAGKTKLVSWFVSNCHPGNHRMRYAQELSQFIQVWPISMRKKLLSRSRLLYFSDIYGLVYNLPH